MSQQIVNMKYAGFWGVDPGRKGGFGYISGYDGMACAVPMVSEDDRGVNIEELQKSFVPRGWLPKSLAIEWNTGRPGEVPDYAFRFGLQTGQLDAFFKMRGFDVVHVAPSTWKRFLGLPGKTDDPKSEAAALKWEELYPDYKRLIYGPRGGILDGLLDALLIAHWLKVTTLSPVGSKGGKRPPRFQGLTKADAEV